MKRISGIKQRKLRRIIILGTVFFVLFFVIAILSYQLYRATRMNQYSKNIWLNHNYFLNDYDAADAEKGQPEARQAVGKQLAEQSWSIVADGDLSFLAKTDFLSEAIHRLYRDGAISSYELNEVAFMIRNHEYQDAIAYINKVMGFECLSSAVFPRHIKVPYLSQKGILPNGCEAVSATMLLQFNGYKISPVDFCDKYLDKEKVYIKWGCRYGPNPYLFYAGDPKSEKGGWGCFAPVIVRGLNKCLSDDHYAYNLSGKDLDSLISDYVAKDIPVAIWTTRSMEEINEVYQWQSYDKKETFLYPVGQHCMVLTGYDNEYYYFNDPYNNNGQVKFEKEKVVYSYNSMGRQAVAILEKNTQPVKSQS